MNSLQKKAWFELFTTTVAVIISGIGVGILVHFNAKGVVGLMSFLIAGLIVGLYSHLREVRLWANLDEREKKIAFRAFVLGAYTFVLFVVIASFATLFLIGGRGRIAVYALPVISLIGIFISQFMSSAAILIRFAREQADGQ